MLLKRIRYLDISNNKITNKAMYYLNKFLIKNQTLSVLYMSNNPYLTIEGIRLIINALQMHPNIIKFDVSNMNLEGSGQFFSTLLNENKSLQELNLRNTNLSKSDITFLSSKLGIEECSIINLDIGLNSNIGDEGLKEIGKIINNNRSIKSIGLDGLNLSMNNYLPIFEAIYKNRSIESYSLNMNSGLPLKGILNFFLKNLQVKEISIIPWDIEKEQDNCCWIAL
jgi:Ran GTPase-activating protein (RanGAP) involved in mRNA processing and transport